MPAGVPCVPPGHMAWLIIESRWRPIAPLTSPARSVSLACRGTSGSDVLPYLGAGCHWKSGSRILADRADFPGGSAKRNPW